jgi:hypothetical protein
MDALCFGFRHVSGGDKPFLRYSRGCLKAEETMRTEYARAYSQGTWGTAVGESSDPSVVSRFGQRTTATCIPHA